MRPVIDFACVIYHPLLTKEQFKSLENLQRRIMKIIDPAGPTQDLEPLHERRKRLADSFAMKLEKNPRFSKAWLVEKPRNNYGTRNEERYLVHRPKTERMARNPLDYFRRRLNYLNNRTLINDPPPN